MIESRNIVRGGPEWQISKMACLKDGVGPGALRRNGALFRGRRNFWDVADAQSETETLGLRAPAPQMFVSDVWDALPLWHIGR
jgi:hypothetical protein